jgi:hypothetical protein
MAMMINHGMEGVPTFEAIWFGLIPLCLLLNSSCLMVQSIDAWVCWNRYPKNCWFPHTYHITVSWTNSIALHPHHDWWKYVKIHRNLEPNSSPLFASFKVKVAMPSWASQSWMSCKIAAASSLTSGVNEMLDRATVWYYWGINGYNG